MILSKPQSQIANDPARFRVAICGRRFGKTYLSIRELCYQARLTDQEVWYVAPSYKQAKNIVFKPLRQRLLELRWVKKINETELTFELKNGSMIKLKGADHYDSLRGVGLDFLVLDEFADIKPEAWYETLRPTLSDKKGRGLFIGTPKGIGNWSYDIFNQHTVDPDNWSSYQFTTLAGGNVSEDEIESAKRDLDIKTFNQEYCATFETFSGVIYYNFDRKTHVEEYRGEIPNTLHIGGDFNIDPMSAVIAVKTGNVLHIIDEFKIYGSNTEELVEEVKTRYPGHTIIAYPDPAGAQRKTSAGGKTDHTILRTAGFTVKAPHSHNAVRDGINAVNAKLLSSSGFTTLFFDPKCKYAIECLEKHIYKEGTSIPEKGGSPDFSHMNDALRYMVDYLFPIRQPTTPIPVRQWGHKIG
jgi:hypothetical protein